MPDRSPDSVPAPVPGRGRPAAEVGLQRLRTSWVLKACAISAFMGYGGLIALVLASKLDFVQAGLIALLSLASWFFLFWWFPILQKTQDRLGPEPSGRFLGQVLEGVGLSCIVIVHVLMALIVVHSARS